MTKIRIELIGALMFFSALFLALIVGAWLLFQKNFWFGFFTTMFIIAIIGIIIYLREWQDGC